MGQIREMYKDDFSEEDLTFIENCKYKGKTADEWIEETKNANGLDEDGNPNWFTPMAYATDAITWAKIKLLSNK